jgi:hypothetical protein
MLQWIKGGVTLYNTFQVVMAHMEIMRRIGGEALREVAASLKISGKAEDLNAVNDSVPKLENEFDRLKEAMEKYFER